MHLFKDTIRLEEKNMPAKVTTIYQLKIVLQGIQPQIWRRIQVPADIDLHDLHVAIQAAMGWTNSHLHSFDFEGIGYTAHYEEGDLEELRMEDERGVALSELISAPKDAFTYDYDFGDSWEHIVTLEKVLSPIADTKYPLCLEGKRACPPEDCGGVYGYASLLKILRKPSHEDYQDMKTWVGRKFDPEAYDVESFGKNWRKIRSYLRADGYL